MDIRTIWRVPKYLPYLQPTLTDEIIKKAEDHIGQKLPKEYLELLRIQNGGYIRFTIAETPHSQIYGIGLSIPATFDPPFHFRLTPCSCKLTPSGIF